MELFTYSPFGVALLSWGAIALEFTIALAIFFRRPALRRALLTAGISFHALIAVDMGLVSFFVAMTGALLLYLLPPGHHIGQVDMVKRLVRGGPRRAELPDVPPSARSSPMPEAVTTTPTPSSTAQAGDGNGLLAP
jgi:hypothetical protein